MAASIARALATLGSAERGLDHLSPTRILDRGYSLTTVEGSARPLRDPEGVRPGQALLTTLARGRLRSVVGGDRARRSGPRAPEATQRSLFDEEGS